MAGEDTQILANGNMDVLTIIPAGKIANGNGIICNKLNNNGTAVNGKIGLITGENGRLIAATGDEKSNSLNTEFADTDISCGWGPCRPQWLQFFATKQAFLFIFCLTWVLQGMYSTYFVSVITTIEKLFQIQSKTTGIIMSATEIGQIGSSLLLTYYGGQGHRPKWIAWGMILFAMSSLMCSMPHFIFGEQRIKLNEMHFNPVGIHGITGSNDSLRASVCTLDIRPNGTAENSNNSMMNIELMTQKYCDDEEQKAQSAQGKKITAIVLAIFFVSLLGVGMGQTAVYTLGIPYIDDNVASRESPLYFAITIGVRILGPALGFILGSFCTMIYVDLSADPQITPKDTNFVGAWWLGLVMISAMLLVVSIPMFAFPSKLPSKQAPKTTPRIEDSKRPSLKDFPKAVKRLLKNDILMYRTASSVLHILPIAGLYTFLPKYLETQFRLTAYQANMISGVGGILVMGLGIIISGVFILRVKPNARFVAAWIAFTAVIYAIGMGILMFIGCPMDDFVGLSATDNSPPSFKPICTTNCSCDPNKFTPICGVDQKTYFSACHAGCSNYTMSDNKVSSYYNCQCIGEAESPGQPKSATLGYCQPECTNFWVYIILFSVFVFIHSTSEVGSMLLILRCVDPRDKAMALGLIQFAIGLFGNVPCPIVYGAVVDWACRVWEYSCGERGACWLYDSTTFRKFFHGTTGGILLLAFLVDLLVWYKAGSISFQDEQTSEEESAEEMSTLKTHDAQTANNDYL